jgi:hypothetical protein
MKVTGMQRERIITGITKHDNDVSIRDAKYKNDL